MAGHRLNVIPSALDPEKGEVYIISTFDDTYNTRKVQTSDQVNQLVGDPDDYKALLESHIVWTENYHFVMNGRGEITSPEIVNEIAPLIPIVEISIDKDGKYWVDSGSEISRFGIEFCAQLSNWAHIVNLQGYAQAYLKGPEDLQPKSIKIGPNYILRLITNPAENKEIEFGYANPNSDLNGVKDLVMTLLSLFLTSEDVDPTTVSGEAKAQTFGTGVERLLSMIEGFKPSKNAMALYEKAEMDMFKIITAWLDKLKGTEALDPIYYTDTFNGSGSISVKYKGPENILSETDELDIVDRRMENRTMSRIGAVMRLEGLTKEEAIEFIDEVDEEDAMDTKPAPVQDQNNIFNPENNPNANNVEMNDMMMMEGTDGTTEGNDVNSGESEPEVQS